LVGYGVTVAGVATEESSNGTVFFSRVAWRP